MLYNMSREKSLRRIIDIENKNREDEQSIKEKKVLTDETLKVVDDVRERRIEELFRKFDYDFDGFIKVEDDGQIDVNDLNADEIALLSPIIIKIEKKRLVVDLPKFKRMLVKEIKKMNVDQRNKLMGPPKREPKF